ncbi:hypothetical protein [Pseudomonas syringae group genomosp. 7]|uniref:hypothetical protein n=1 Tax=Pseudomonas syringae group genomosp. 7 TaxID=251699 RepID=UPI000F3D51C4|nr:hypothetical protein [Pseudomonas syringae group genomosp. 7]RMW17445.1 hypothetical protein ALO98_200452 [Pseudomonas syringae pv. tagetis]
MSNHSKLRKQKIESDRLSVANRWYWCWLPNRSWQAIMFVGLGTAAMIMFVSWARGLPFDLNIRAAAVAVVWLIFTALVYSRDRALAQIGK